MSSRAATSAIPVKRVLLNDPNQLPSNYSTTPGGTLYSTTPGGTRIVYERSTLMYLRNSPLSKTPPNIPDLPDSMNKGEIKSVHRNGLRTSPLKKAHQNEDRGEQFEIDI